MLSLDIRKQFDAFTLDLAFEARQERIIVLFGASGAGKSLTLAAVAGFLSPDRGRIAVGDRVLFDAERGVNLEPQARRIGLVRQDLALFPHLSAADNIAYGMRGSRAEKKRRVGALLELVQLGDFGARKPGELSGGQQQRVALARALAIDPALLLLDEPFSALDLGTRMELRRELKALQQRLNTSMLFVTHDLGEAVLLADSMAVLDNGRILQFATPHEILRAPRNARVARIVGVKNILPARVVNERCVRIGERELETDTKPWLAGTDMFACIRSERVLLVRREGPVRAHPNAMEGELLEDESDGNDVVLRFRADGARLQPEQDFDLLIDMPVYVYERLQLAGERHWLISLKPNVLHLVPD